MWLQNTKAHDSVLTAAEHSQLAALGGPRPTAFRLLGLHHRGDDVIQEVRQAALHFVALTSGTVMEVKP